MRVGELLAVLAMHACVHACTHGHSDTCAQQTCTRTHTQTCENALVRGEVGAELERKERQDAREMG